MSSLWPFWHQRYHTSHHANALLCAMQLHFALYCTMHSVPVKQHIIKRNVLGKLWRMLQRIIMRNIYALQVCIATCVNTLRTSNTSSGSLHCIIHRGARIITMHNAPSTTSTKKHQLPMHYFLLPIWTTIFQWKSSLALHHNSQKCPWRAGQCSNGAATRNVPSSKKKWVRAIISEQF